MNRWSGKVAIVTGCSSGIGKAIAIKLVEEGMIVAGLARRIERLDELALQLENQKGEFHPIQSDLSKGDDIIKTFEYISNKLGPIHVLINNAGVHRIAPLSSGKTEQWKEILDTNVLGLCVATREAVKNMATNDVAGQIIHINSLMGHPISKEPTAVYGASKYAITSLTECLRNELIMARSKTKVTSISPGHVITEIMDTACEKVKDYCLRNLQKSLK